MLNEYLHLSDNCMIMDEHSVQLILPEQFVDDGCEDSGSGFQDKCLYNDYTWCASVLSLLCFVMPTGVYAVKYANQAKRAMQKGRILEANCKARDAILAMTTTVVTPFILTLTIIILIMYT